MSNQEIADWGNISKSYLEKRKDKWCKKNFLSKAKYRTVRGGVEILEIYDPVFSSSGKQEVHDKYLDYYGNGKQKIDSCINCYNKIKNAGVIKAPLSDSTLYNYVCSSRRKDFGVSKKYDGELGSSRWVFCKIMPNGDAELFTEQEQEIKKKLEQKYLKSNTGVIYESRAIISAYKQKEITKEEYDEMLEELLTTEVGWDIFEAKFTEAIGYPVDFRIELIQDGIKYYVKEKEIDDQTISKFLKK